MGRIDPDKPIDNIGESCYITHFVDVVLGVYIPHKR